MGSSWNWVIANEMVVALKKNGGCIDAVGNGTHESGCILQKNMG